MFYKSTTFLFLYNFLNIWKAFNMTFDLINWLIVLNLMSRGKKRYVCRNRTGHQRILTICFVLKRTLYDIRCHHSQLMLLYIDTSQTPKWKPSINWYFCQMKKSKWLYFYTPINTCGLRHILSHVYMFIVYFVTVTSHAWYMQRVYQSFNLQLWDKISIKCYKGRFCIMLYMNTTLSF